MHPDGLFIRLNIKTPGNRPQRSAIFPERNLSAMKKLARILTAVTLACLLFGLYSHFAGKISVRYISSEVTPAVEMENVFLNLRTAAQRSEAGVSLLSGQMPGSADECFFLTLRYDIRNFGPLPAEWITFDIVPESGDVMQVLGTEFDVGPFGHVQAEVTLLVQNGGSTGPRSVTAHYYVLGDAVDASADSYR